MTKDEKKLKTFLASDNKLRYLYNQINRNNDLSFLSIMNVDVTVETLIQLFKTDDPYCWVVACALSEISDELYEIGNERAAGPIAEWVKRKQHRKHKYGWQVIDALGNVGDARAVEPLAIALEVEELKRNDRSVEPQQVRRALGKLENRGEINESAVETLIELLTSKRRPCKYGHTRTIASSFLGKIGDKRAVKPLIETLSDDRINVLKAVAKALDKIGDKRAVKPLIKTFKKENLGLTKISAMAIVKMEKLDEADNILKFLESKDPAMVRMGASMLEGILEE